MKKIQIIILILLSALFTSINAQDMKCNTSMANASKDTVLHKAVCMVYPTQGNTVTGTVSFTEIAGGGVKVTADLHGLSTGKHGIHIHQCGDCSAVDGTSAGSHYNPGMQNHGAPMDSARHEGDMGNIEADASGTAHLEYIDNTISLKGCASIVGRSIIIHKNEDDLKTQPTGNAGARIGCGVIGIIK
jgi:superoxide dismutase, Cu-Zn family